MHICKIYCITFYYIFVCFDPSLDHNQGRFVRVRGIKKCRITKVEQLNVAPSVSDSLYGHKIAFFLLLNSEKKNQ